MDSCKEKKKEKYKRWNKRRGAKGKQQSVRKTRNVTRKKKKKKREGIQKRLSEAVCWRWLRVSEAGRLRHRGMQMIASNSIRERSRETTKFKKRRKKKTKKKKKEEKRRLFEMPGKVYSCECTSYIDVSYFEEHYGVMHDYSMKHKGRQRQGSNSPKTY